MDSRIKPLLTTDTNFVFFEINGYLDASHVKAVLKKENYSQTDDQKLSESEARKYYKENPYATPRLYFISKQLGVERYQRTFKRGDPEIIRFEILEKGFSFTFTGNPSLVLLEPGDIVIMKKV